MDVIQTYNLRRSFQSIAAVRDISLHVPAGSVYSFLGPNGAGKTTTIRMLLGLTHPDAGAVHLFGKPFATHRMELLARLGALVESPSLYPHLTGRENLEVRRRLIGRAKADIARALQMVRLEQDANRLARGYSLGMRQRLGLAQALLGHPELLILDEPTNGLDPAGIHEMRALLRALPGDYGITVFLSSHMLSEVEQVATNIGIVFEGRLLFEGELNDLRSQREEHLVLGVDRAADAARALEDAGWQVRDAGPRRLRIAVRGNAAAAQVNALLVGLGFAIHHLALEQPTLEQTFLEMTQAA